VTFDEIATAWLEHRIAVVGIKRTTRNDYETMLLPPRARPKKPRCRPVRRRRQHEHTDSKLTSPLSANVV
jgi:hypothetical protein